MILLIDNYDSFTYNLAHLFQELGAEVTVVRNDKIDADEAERLAPTHLVISPGPGRPSDGGISSTLIRRFSGRIPVLGVCLGHQCLVEVEGGEVGPARRLMHGKAGTVSRVGDDPILEGLPPEFEAGRYHSLAAFEPLPETLIVTARDADGEIMAVRHRDHEGTHGVQFHPESILSEHGRRLVANFLEVR